METNFCQPAVLFGFALMIKNMGGALVGSEASRLGDICSQESGGLRPTTDGSKLVSSGSALSLECPHHVISQMTEGASHNSCTQNCYYLITLMKTLNLSVGPSIALPGSSRAR